MKISLLPAILLLSCFTVKAQEIESNIRMLKSFKADGISNEWNEPLNEYNSATKLAFALANDDQNLYLIIESLDPETTMKVLSGGITLNINTAGKKKTGIELTFPLRERSTSLTDNEQKTENGIPEHKDINENHIPREMPDEKTMRKRIKVSGFKNIPEGIISVENSFGIQTGMTVKPNRDLIYEIAIPLTQLEIGVDFKKAIAYNIKINAGNKRGPAKAGMHEGSEGGRSRGGGGMGGGGRGGMGGGGRMGGGGGRVGQQRPQAEPGAGDQKSDFWIKYLLVTS